MKSTESEINAISLANARAALDQCYSIIGTDREAVKAAHWARLPIGVKRIAVMSANLPKERADDTLNKFNSVERGRINVCVARLMRDMTVITKCMQGGKLPATEAVH